MNEQAFTYEHFDNASYLFAAFGLMNVAVMFSYVLKLPLLVLYLVFCFSVFIYAVIRMVAFLRRYRTVTSKEQGKIIRRNMYSRKWGVPLIAISCALTYLVARVFETNITQTVSFFSLSFMLLSLVGIRIFLRDLKERMVASA